MTLNEVKTALKGMQELDFRLPTGDLVPQHFHITEVGIIDKHFIDCGGKVRREKTVSFQLWEANDYKHRLSPKKLLDIINLSEKELGIEDAEVEVEYQSTTIGIYGLEVQHNEFQLINKYTDCLAKDKCGIDETKPKININELVNKQSCDPNSGCC